MSHRSASEIMVFAQIRNGKDQDKSPNNGSRGIAIEQGFCGSYRMTHIPQTRGDVVQPITSGMAEFMPGKYEFHLEFHRFGATAADVPRQNQVRERQVRRRLGAVSGPLPAVAGRRDCAVVQLRSQIQRVKALFRESTRPLGAYPSSGVSHHRDGVASFMTIRGAWRES